MSVTHFDSTKSSLKDLLHKVADGTIQLPDFQRGWVWEDAGIRSLLASISQGFPVGALMTLAAGGQIRFQTRPVEGAHESAWLKTPDILLLDGQQRLTSLFQAIVRGKVVETQNAQKKKIRRWYYIDMATALDPAADREEAIIGVPENRIVTSDFGRKIELDLSTSEKEVARLMYPVSQILDDWEWADRYKEHWSAQGDKARVQLYKTFKDTVLRAFHEYQVPVITLGKDTPKQAVCLVFEKVNTGGKKLDAFELLTAIFAAEDGEFRLRDDWYGGNGLEGRKPRLSAFNVLREVSATDFMQAVTLLHTKERRQQDKAAGRPEKEWTPISSQRQAMLNLPLGAYRRLAPKVEQGFVLAGKFLRTQKIYWFKDVPYQTQLIPLAAILGELGEHWDKDEARRKVARWFWCGVFGELYGSTVETRFGRDVVEVPAWIAGGEEPTTVREATFRMDRLDSLYTRLSAAYKGVQALLMREGARDFRSGQAFDDTVYFDESVDIHHVFPKAWCEKRKIPKRRFDSIVNKTPLSARTNRIIGGKAPSTYLDDLARNGAVTTAALDGHVGTHRIDPGLLRADDFEGYISHRREALTALIEQAMQKKAYRGDQQDEPAEAVEMEEESG